MSRQRKEVHEALQVIAGPLVDMNVVLSWWTTSNKHNFKAQSSNWKAWFSCQKMTFYWFQLSTTKLLNILRLATFSLLSSTAVIKFKPRNQFWACAEVSVTIRFLKPEKCGLLIFCLVTIPLPFPSFICFLSFNSFTINIFSFFSPVVITCCIFFM